MCRPISWRFVILLVAVAGFAGCDFQSERRFAPDAQWHERALVDSHLAHWLAVALSESGFLYWNVTRTWQRREQKTTMHREALDLAARAKAER